jgi:hypothetical protein
MHIVWDYTPTSPQPNSVKTAGGRNYGDGNFYIHSKDQTAPQPGTIVGRQATLDDTLGSMTIIPEARKCWDCREPKQCMGRKETSRVELGDYKNDGRTEREREQSGIS